MHKHDNIELLDRVGDLLAIDPSMAGGRLSLTYGSPYHSAVENATSVYYTWWLHNQIALYDGTEWRAYTIPDMSVSLAGTVADNIYDVFAYVSSAGEVKMWLGPAWSSKSDRSVPYAKFHGVFVHSEAVTINSVTYAVGRMKYLGSVYTTGNGYARIAYGTEATNGGTASHGLWNLYNRLPITGTVHDSTASFTYGTAMAWQPIMGSVNNSVFLLSGLGLGDTSVEMVPYLVSSNGHAYLSIGVDSSSTPNTTACNRGRNTTTGGYEYPRATYKAPAMQGFHGYYGIIFPISGAITTALNNASQAGLSYSHAA